MKLKTLKDIEKEVYEKMGISLIHPGKIKAEAIKWVKYFRKIPDSIEEDKFMEFHNITEEDLK